MGSRTPRASSASLLTRVLSSRAYFACTVLVCFLIAFLDTVLEASHEPFPSRPLVWGVGGAACAALLLDTAAGAVAGFVYGVEELRSPISYVIDGIPIISLLVWPALHGRVYNAVGKDSALTADEFDGYLRDVSRARIVIATLVLPLAFLKVVTGSWRLHALRHSRSRRASSSWAPHSGHNRVTRGMSQWLMVMTAVSCAGILLCSAMMESIPRRYSAEGDFLAVSPNLFEGAKSQPFRLQVLLDTLDTSEAVGAPGRHVTHVFIDGEVVKTLPDAPPGDPLADGYEPGVWLRSDESTSFMRCDFRGFFMEDLAAQTRRKYIPLAACVVVLFTTFYLAGWLMVLPLQQLLASLVRFSASLDARGVFVEGRDARGMDLSIEEAVDRVEEFMRIMQKAYAGGRVVLQRLMHQAAGGEGGAEAAVEWADMYRTRRPDRGAVMERRAFGTSQGSQGTNKLTAAIHDRVSQASSHDNVKAPRSKALSNPGRNPSRFMSMTELGDSAKDSDRFIVVKDDVTRWEWSAVTEERDTLGAIVMGMFVRLDLVTEAEFAEGGRLPRRRLQALLPLIEASYSDHPYHNWPHAVDVTHGMFILLSNAREVRGRLGTWDRAALMLAALAHDMGHRGTNNAFLVATRDPLAIRYNDMAVQENMHAARLFEVMTDHPEADVLAGLDEAAWGTVRTAIVTSVMGTDMALHFDLVAKLETMAEAETWVDSNVSPSADNVRQTRLSPSEHKLMIQTLLHLADLFMMFREGQVVMDWTDRVMREFFEQGEMEKALGMQPQALMVEELTYVPGAQAEFYEIIMRPFVSAVAARMPSVGDQLRRRLARNFGMWMAVVDHDKGATSAPARVLAHVPSDSTGRLIEFPEAPEWTGGGAPIAKVDKYLGMDTTERFKRFATGLGLDPYGSWLHNAELVASPSGKAPAYLEKLTRGASARATWARARLAWAVDRAARALFPALSSPFWFAGIAVGCLLIAYLDLVLEEAYEPFPPVGVVWGVAMGAAAFILIDAALHLLVAWWLHMPDLLAPTPYVLDAVAFLAMFVWPALHSLVYNSVSAHHAVVGREETPGYIDDVTTTRKVVSFLVLPLVFLKIVAAAWRQRSMSYHSMDVAGGGGYKQGTGHRWTQWLMCLTALSVCAVLVVETLVAILPDSFNGVAFAMWRYVGILAANNKLSPNGPVDGSPLQAVTTSAGSNTGPTTNLSPSNAITHVLVRLGGQPDAAFVTALQDDDFDAITDPFAHSHLPPAVWVTDPEYTVLLRYDYRMLLLNTGKEDALRKLLPLLICIVLLVCNFYIMSALMVTPLQDLLSKIVESAALLDHRGVLVGHEGRNDRLTGFAALTRIVDFLQIMHKANEGGRTVMKRLMAGATEVDGASGMRAWARMYGPRMGSDEGGAGESSRVLASSTRTTASGAEDAATSSRVTQGAHNKSDSGAEDGWASEPQAVQAWSWSSLLVDREQLQDMVMAMFEQLKLVTDEDTGSGGRLPKERLRALLPLIEASYSDHPYHNWPHAVDVTHGMFILLSNAREVRGRLGTWDRAALMLAALAHDMGHRGTNNAFLVATRDPLAIRYNDMAVQENMHAARLFEVMTDHPEADVLAGLDEAAWGTVRTAIVTSVMGTDMAVHFDLVANLETMAETRSWVNDVSSTSGPGATCKDRALMLQALLHLADLFMMFREGQVVMDWTDRVMREFFEQGEMEKALGMQPQALMVEELTYVPGAQAEFYEIIMRPFVSAVAARMPSVGDQLRRRLARNFGMWMAVVEHDKVVAETSSDGITSSSNRLARPSLSPTTVHIDFAVRHDDLPKFRGGGAPIIKVPKHLNMRPLDRMKAFMEALALPLSDLPKWFEISLTQPRVRPSTLSQV